MKDYPYSILKQEDRSYQIMLLRDQEGKPFPGIAKRFGLSPSRARKLYYRIKIKQIRLYLNHIAAALGQENASQVYKIFDSAYESYQSWEFACAYLEKEYPEILREYRDGEPGAPLQFIQSLPPLKPKLDKKTVLRLVELRETEKLPYREIAERLKITPGKAKYTYDWYYHEQELALLDGLAEQAGSQKEKSAILEYYYQTYRTPKKRYEALAKK